MSMRWLLLAVAVLLALLAIATLVAIIDNRINYGRWRPTKGAKRGSRDE